MFELKRHSGKLDLSVKVGDTVVPVALDIATQGRAFNQRFSELVNSEIEVKRISSKLFSITKNQDAEEVAQAPSFEDLEDARQVYGHSLVALMTLVFGDPGAKIIFDFFDNDYEDLLLSIIPFFKKELIPALEKVRDDKAKRYAKAGIH